MPVCAIGRRSLVTTSIIIPHGLLHIAIIEACVLLSSLFIPMHMIHDFLISFDHWLVWGINLFLKKKCHQGVVLEIFYFIHAVYNWRPIFCLSVWENSFRFQGVVRSALPVTRIKVHLPYFWWSCLLERKEECFLATNKFRHQEASHKSFYIGLLSSRDVHEKKRDNFVFIVANSLPKRRSLVVKPLWFSIAPYKNKNNTEGRKNKVWFLFYFFFFHSIAVSVLRNNRFILWSHP